MGQTDKERYLEIVLCDLHAVAAGAVRLLRRMREESHDARAARESGAGGEA